MKTIHAALFFAACLFLFSTGAFSVTVERLDSIPLAFTLNEGQVDHSIQFTAQGSGCGMAFSPTGTTFLLSRETASSVAKRAAKKSVLFEDDPAKDQPEYEGFALKLTFVGANENPVIQGEDRLPWNNNYFIGNDSSKWRTDVPNYKKIRLTEVYDGIDLVYYGNRKRVKYDFVVKPGEDPNKILLKYDFGAAGGSLSVNEKGELVVKTPVGELIEEKPYCYQKINEKEVEVEVGYEVIEGGTYRFRIGAYDTGAELVIDPELVYSTYLGGLPGDYATAVSIDAEGYVYVTGKTGFITTRVVENFPVTPGAYDTQYYGVGSDVFVTKLNRDGSQIIFSTLIGGDNSDEPAAIVLDSNNNVVVTGKTISDNFPKTDTSFSDNKDLFGFIFKLSADGKQLKFSSLFGGYCSGVSIGQDDFLYVLGIPPANDFYATPGAYDTKMDYKWAAGYIRKLSPDGINLIYSTLIEACFPRGISCDKSGNVYIVGWTQYFEFPATPGAFDTTYSLAPDGAYQLDGFIAKLNTDGSKLLYATYFGGSKNDDITDITVDSEGTIVFCGNTASTDFPVTENAPVKESQGSNNIFLGRIDIEKNTLLLSTYFCGGAMDPRICLDLKNNIYMTGLSLVSSGTHNIPVTNDAIMKTPNNGFFSIFRDSGKTIYATYWGGSSGDWCRAITVNEHNTVAIVGETESRDFPISANAVDDSVQYSTYNPNVPGKDAFVSVFSTDDLLSVQEETAASPIPFILYQPYPNPFNPSTTITYSLSRPDFVKLNVYTVTGQKVETLYSGYQKGGMYHVTWNADSYSSGTYVIVLEMKQGKLSRKVSLLK